MLRFGLSVSLSLILLPALALAADKPALTRAQIEQCLQDRQDVVARNDALSATKAALDVRGDALLQSESRLSQAHNDLAAEHHVLAAQDDELKRHGDDLNEYIPRVGPVKKLSDAYIAHVARYNEQVRAHQSLLDQYNHDVANYNTQLAPVEQKARETDHRCVAAPVTRGDLNAAKAAVGDAPRKKVAPEVREIP